jgi:ABC-type sugar transport system permease subunit
MPAIIAMSIWQGLGVNVIIFLAALQAIPSELLDAASVDGGGRWARFRWVILPLLTPAIFFTGVLSLIDAFQVFDQVFVLVKPRPTDATITIVYFIYENGFKFFKMGLASAAVVGTVPDHCLVHGDLLLVAEPLGPLPVSARTATADEAIRTQTAHRARTVRRALVIGLLIAGGVLMMVPFLWMITTSLKARAEVFADPPNLLPLVPQWQNFPDMWSSLPFATFFINSFKIAGLNTVGQLISCSMAAFAFSGAPLPVPRAVVRASAWSP